MKYNRKEVQNSLSKDKEIKFSYESKLDIYSLLNSYRQIPTMEVWNNLL